MLANKLFLLATLFMVSGIVSIAVGYLLYAVFCIVAAWIMAAGVWFEFKNSI